MRVHYVDYFQHAAAGLFSSALYQQLSCINKPKPSTLIINWHYSITSTFQSLNYGRTSPDSQEHRMHATRQPLRTDSSFHAGYPMSEVPASLIQASANSYALDVRPRVLLVHARSAHPRGPGPPRASSGPCVQEASSEQNR